jgi:Protein of unknown function (DUF2384)
MSSSTDNLEHYYLGDKAWNRLADLAIHASLAPPAELIAACGGDERLAAVVYRAIGESALAWMDRTIPALGGLSPRQCLDSETLLRRLRSALMRIP